MNTILVDTSHLLYRSWHTFQKLSNKSGHPTGIHFGVMRTIEHLKKTYGPVNIVFVLDGKCNQRRAIYPHYKAGRGKTESHAEIVHELGMTYDVIDLVKAAGCSVVRHDEYESDDLIAMLSTWRGRYLHKCWEPGEAMIIYSGDNDFCQLIDNYITLLKPPAGSGPKQIPEHMVYPAEVEKEWGVKPCSMALYRSFLGDSGDNIPGLPRVPRAPLQEALAGKRSPGDFYEGNGLAYFTPQWKQKLTEFEPQCRINYRLCALPWTYEDQLTIEYHEYGCDISKLEVILQRLEFTSFLKKLGALAELLTPTAHVKAVSRLTNGSESRSDSATGLANSLT